MARLIAFVVLFASLTLAGALFALSRVPVSVEDLARGSDAVVRGRVERVTTRWTEDGKSIFTYVDVRPSNVWRGSTPTLVTGVVPPKRRRGRGPRPRRPQLEERARGLHL